MSLLYNSRMKNRADISPIIEQLRAARIAAGMTQRDVAAALNFSHAMASHWENGTSAITLADAERYAALVGMRLVCVLSDSNRGPAD